MRGLAGVVGRGPGERLGAAVVQPAGREVVAVAGEVADDQAVGDRTAVRGVVMPEASNLQYAMVPRGITAEAGRGSGGATGRSPGSVRRSRRSG